MINIKKLSSPEQISDEWDINADNFFMKKSFLKYLHLYNYCNQRYYELYVDNNFVIGTIVYTLKINLFTFSKIQLYQTMQIIGLPVSIAAEPLVGNRDYAEELLNRILSIEKGLILGINFKCDYLKKRVVNLRTLPTILFNSDFADIQSYKKALRHPYRRRINNAISKFNDVVSIKSSCSEFTHQHYAMYLDIIKRTTTKLEVLSYNFFKNLPSNFILNTHYNKETILAWNICEISSDILYFFFGGINYDKRDQFNSYHNNLLSIFLYAINNNYKTIDFGQTAEISKLRLGGAYSERRMFLYQKNGLIMFFIKIFKRLINYSKRYKIPRVINKTNNSVNYTIYENNVC